MLIVNIAGLVLDDLACMVITMTTNVNQNDDNDNNKAFGLVKS